MNNKSEKEVMNKKSAEASVEVDGFDGLCRELTMEEILLVSAGGPKGGGGGGGGGM